MPKKKKKQPMPMMGQPIQIRDPNLARLWNDLRALERNIVGIEISVTNCKEFFLGLKSRFQKLLEEDQKAAQALQKVAKTYEKTQEKKA